LKRNKERTFNMNGKPLSRTALFAVAITVSLLLTHIPQTVRAQDYGHYGGIIPLNRLIGGTITDEVHFIEYTFTGRAGQEVFITLQAAGYGNLDPYVKLRGPDSTVLEEDDDDWDDHAWSTRNSFLRHRLPANGAYTVTATRYKEHNGSSAGNFLLLVTESDPTVAYYGILSPNQDIIGAISDKIYGVEHTFSGRAGEEVIITMEKFTGNLDTYLYLRGPDGTVLEEDDNDGPGRDSQIEITLLQTGAYTIHATRCEGRYGRSSGQYILHISSGSYSSRQGGILRPNQLIIGYIGRSLNSVTYSFDYTGPLDRGVNAAIRTQFSGQFPNLELYDSSSNQLGIFIPISSRVGMLSCAHLYQTGEHYIKVTVSRKGYYTITLRHPAYAR